MGIGKDDKIPFKNLWGSVKELAKRKTPDPSPKNDTRLHTSIGAGAAADRHRTACFTTSMPGSDNIFGLCGNVQS